LLQQPCSVLRLLLLLTAAAAVATQLHQRQQQHEVGAVGVTQEGLIQLAVELHSPQMLQAV
jgi:predicted transcriptional regulator